MKHMDIIKPPQFLTYYDLMSWKWAHNQTLLICASGKPITVSFES